MAHCAHICPGLGAPGVAEAGLAMDLGLLLEEHRLLDVVEPLVRVPLLLRIPGTDPSRRPDVASLVDLAPTLLHHFLGRPVPEGAAGRDLLEPFVISWLLTIPTLGLSWFWYWAAVSAASRGGGPAMSSADWRALQAMCD